jgi:flagellar assembly protein FliH
MPVKIIKQGSLHAGLIKPISYGADLAPSPPRDSTVPPWMEIANQNKVQPVTDAPLPPVKEPAIPSIDLAQLEKTAYENGFHQGEKAGMEMAERKMEAVMRRYSESILEVARLKPALYAAVERDVTKLALEVAKKIVHREIQADREIIITLVKVALSHVSEKSAVTVHLHPVDYNYLLEHRAELTNGAGNGREIMLLADKSIERGGCLVQSECGDIDARIEEEFREVERSFFEGAKKG